jgi:hypothetical protein
VIYQFYFQKDQICFNHDLYRPFGLYPEVNDQMSIVCPEIETEKQFKQLNENSGILFLGRQLPDDTHTWIGFTSYAQLKKCDYIFDDNQFIERKLEECDAIAWYQQYVPKTIVYKFESPHPCIHSFLIKMFYDLGEEMPSYYFAAKRGAWCNYWIMKKENFLEYHEWYSKFVLYCLEAIKNPDASQQFFLDYYDRHIGNLLELVFQIWCYKNKLKLYHPQDDCIYEYAA